LFVPSITIVLPFGGADLSGVVMLIDVGSDLYCERAAVAAATDPELDVDAAFVAVVPEEPEEPDDADEVEELEEPQAASARAIASMPTSTANPRTRGRPPRRRSSFEWYVMWVSFGSALRVTSSPKGDVRARVDALWVRQVLQSDTGPR
jgi:hypothetical protein